MNNSACIRFLVVVLLALLLSGCMLTRQPAPLSIVAPDVKVQPDQDWPSVDWSIQVQRPIADQMRDSDRILVRRTPSRLQVYPGAAWLDSVPEMLQAMMIRALSDSERFTGVGRAGGMRSRYSLITEVRHFEAIDDGGMNLEVELVIQAGLIHQRSSRVVATKTFRQQQLSTGKQFDPMVTAYEQALSGLMVELVGWVLDEGVRAQSEWEAIEEDRSGHWRERR
jgi:cholesterol transport system auxiliary component